MRKLISKFSIWLFNKFVEKGDRNHITYTMKLYRKEYRRNFNVKAEIIKVKKGKRCYEILWVETADGKLKFNLNRKDISGYHMVEGVVKEIA